MTTSYIHLIPITLSPQIDEIQTPHPHLPTTAPLANFLLQRSINPTPLFMTSNSLEIRNEVKLSTCCPFIYVKCFFATFDGKFLVAAKVCKETFTCRNGLRVLNCCAQLSTYSFVCGASSDCAFACPISRW